MTPRDKNAMILLYNNRYLTSLQLSDIIYKRKDDGTINKEKDRITRRCMQRLAKQNYVKIWQPYARQHKIYCLDDLGVALVCSWLNVKYENYAKKENVVNLGYIEHALAINDFYIELLEYCKSNRKNVKNFTVERHNRRTFEYGKEKITFQPDAFFTITDNLDRGKAYYLELDRGTEAPKKFADKVKSYEAFYRQEVFNESWNVSKVHPSILVLCENKNRAERLQGVIRSNLKWVFITNIKELQI